MNEWKNYSLTKKIILGVAITILAFMVPELMVIMDFGGIELTVGFLLLYYKPLISKYNQLIVFLKSIIQILQNSVVNSPLIKPRYYFYHQALSVCLLFVTGSMVLSLSIFMPAIYLGGIL